MWLAAPDMHTQLANVSVYLIDAAWQEECVSSVASLPSSLSL